MKANAPEKLYLNWTEYPLNEIQVEYTRTDAFIEKALKFFKMKFDVTDYYYDRTIDEERIFAYTKLISDFKGYLENESEMPKKP